MASYLYRVGSLAARRAWAVVIAWLLVLGLVGGAALAFGRPFTSKLTIPGTEFQRVLDDLETSLPKAAGGIGTVVFSSTDGTPFTEAQRRSIAQVVSGWSAADGIDTATDPFETQRQLDDAAKQVTDGKKKLVDGRKQISDAEAKLAAGKKKLTDGERQISANEARLRSGSQQLTAGERRLAAGRAQYSSSAAQLAAGRRQLQAGTAQAAQGRAQLRAASSRIAAGQAQLNAKRGEIAQARRQLAALSAQADALAEQNGADDPQVVAIRQRVASETARLNAGQQQLNRKAAELAAGQRTLRAKQAQLADAERKLAAARSRLAAGQAQLSAGKRRLDAGSAALSANRAKLAQGRDQLEQGRSALAKGKADAAAGAKKLADAKAAVPANEAKLARGERRLALMKGLRSVNPAGTVAISQVLFDAPMASVEPATKRLISERATPLADAGVRVDYSKDIVQELNLVGPGEALGVLVAGLVLFVMLGSLLAAGLPLLTALIGVAVGLLGAVAVTYFTEMNEVTPALALMLGLAVGIDYSLFLVNRHREQLARGLPLIESIALATGTAGSAVLFAGLTVIVALSALALTGIPFLGVMGFVAAATVAVSVLVALTLTPALLKLMGGRVLSNRAREALAAKLAAEEAEADAEDAAAGGTPNTRPDHTGRSTGAAGVLHDPGRHEGRGHGWGGLVTRHPWVTLGLATVLLSVLAIPAASLKLGLPDGGYEPHSSTAYRTYHTIGETFGPGRNGPIVAVAKVGPQAASGLTGDRLTDLQLTVGEQLKAVPGVAYVVPIGSSADSRTLAFQVVPTSGPSDDATSTLVTALRSGAAGIVERTGIDSLGYAGQTVANIDISNALGSALPLYLGVVVGISLILLLLVFRSVVIPVLATAGFLLSVAAAFGAVVAVYQWGWLGAALGVEQPGLVLSFLPTLVIGILFGLAMDYQMFLVSGMRESWAHGHAARTAVRVGFSHGARVVTAAALIMISVFASFVHAPLTMVRPIGFALAIGVLIDAFVVRMTAMPAIMHVLGERAWYLPRWLDRVLPDLDVEGTRLESEHPAPDSGADDSAGPAGQGQTTADRAEVAGSRS